MIEYLQTHILIFYIIMVCFGLMIGSFLNVVIYRLPRMLEAGWISECVQFLKGQQAKAPKLTPCPLCEQTHDEVSSKAADPMDDSSSNAKFNLAWPASHCPHCKHAIRFYDNIPLLSYCILRGRCRYCQHRIKARYPIIEGITGLCTLIVAWQYGLQLSIIPVLLLTFALLTLSWIDFEHQILPDNITLPCLWLGLLLNSMSMFVPLNEALFGAIFGYLILWSVYWLFKLTTGKEGMGYGDFKLLSVLGAWLGWKMLPLIILLSSFAGAIVGITLIVLNKQAKGQPIPFGPYLALAGWIALLWGTPITNWYLS